MSRDQNLPWEYLHRRVFNPNAPLYSFFRILRLAKGSPEIFARQRSSPRREIRQTHVCTPRGWLLLQTDLQISVNLSLLGDRIISAHKARTLMCPAIDRKVKLYCVYHTHAYPALSSSRRPRATCSSSTPLREVTHDRLHTNVATHRRHLVCAENPAVYASVCPTIYK